jgi:hypothetical protein
LVFGINFNDLFFLRYKFTSALIAVQSQLMGNFHAEKSLKNENTRCFKNIKPDLWSHSYCFDLFFP